MFVMLGCWVGFVFFHIKKNVKFAFGKRKKISWDEKVFGFTIEIG